MQEKQIFENMKQKLAELIGAWGGLPNCAAEDLAKYLIQNGAVVPEWISATENPPDNSEYDWVLAQVVEDNGFKHIPKVMEYRQQLKDWYEETYGWLSKHNGAFTVTHWMPLPKQPEV